MKTKMHWISPFLLLIAVNVAVAAPLNKAQTQAMKAAYALQDKALLAKNLEAFMARADVNFQRKTRSGKVRVGRALEREYVKDGFQQIKSFDSVSTTLTKTDFVRNKIVVVAQIRFSAVIRNSEGKWTRQSSTSTSRDTWIPTKSGWRIRLTEELS